MNLLQRQDGLDFLHGCTRLEAGATGWRLHRHTEPQLAHYDQASEAWAVRARCSAGIRLSLRTNSRTLELTGRILPGARTYAGFDVEVDGRGLTSLRLDALDPSQTSTQTLRLATFDTQAERTIVVTFPQSAIVELEAIAVEPGATAAPTAPARVRYLALGDSITQGMDARGPASAYPVQLARRLDAELLNLGVGGHVFDVDALDDELPFAPDIVTVAYGTNDWSSGSTQQQISTSVDAYLSRLLATVAASARVFVLTPLWRAIAAESKAGGTLLEFSSLIAEAAARAGVHVIDGTLLVPHAEHLFPDGTHPNDEGFLHYAINLHRLMQLNEA